MSGIMGGAPSASAVPPAVQYTAPPQAQSPQSTQAGQTAAQRSAAAGGAQAALAGMQPGGLDQQASTTQKQALGS
jgi:hypothetical protein